MNDERAPSTRSEDAIARVIGHWQQRTTRTPTVPGTDGGNVEAAPNVARQPPTGRITLSVGPPSVTQYPVILLQAAVVVLGETTAEGQLIREVSIPWFEIVKQLERDPQFMYAIPWRKLEEIIAGAYERAGFPDVILTPRSRDGGRDVIATKPGVGSIRIVDQVKAYAPGHRVPADEVRSLLGVLAVERNVSKGVITTTSEFAPGIFKDDGLRAFMPHRLELKNGNQLAQWLISLSDAGQ